MKNRFNHEGDNMIVVVSALPGGCDGLDSSNRGGPVRAFLDLEEAKKYVGVDTRYEIKTKIMDAKKVWLGLKKKLTVEEKLYLKVLGVDLSKQSGTVVR